MPQQSIPVLEAIVALLNDCSGVDAAVVGQVERPDDVPCTVAVSASDRVQATRTTGTHGIEQLYFVNWMRDVAGDEEACERALLVFLDEFEDRLLAARSTAGHVLARVRWAFELASRPDFAYRTGAETREYPFVLACRHDTNLPL